MTMVWVVGGGELRVRRWYPTIMMEIMVAMIYDDGLSTA